MHQAYNLADKLFATTPVHPLHPSQERRKQIFAEKELLHLLQKLTL